MADKEKSAELIMKLYDLRREEVMRQARSWFFTFNPDSIEDVFKEATGPNNAFYRMVTSYWDMACSFVNHGAIDEEMFNDANQEHNFVYSKIQPFIAEIRAKTGPKYMAHLEQVVMRQPEAEKRLEDLRNMARQISARYAAGVAEQAEADAANA